VFASSVSESACNQQKKTEEALIRRARLEAKTFAQLSRLYIEEASLRLVSTTCDSTGLPFLIVQGEVSHMTTWTIEPLIYDKM
jgi:hypothetical protein